MGFDRKESPFKFDLRVVEPEESTDSAFEINPKVVNVGSRKTEKFTVTFHSDRGVGDFKSILLASPDLSADELSLLEEGDELLKKGALGSIALMLKAWTLGPRLTVDKSVRMDGNNHIAFRYWSVP